MIKRLTLYLAKEHSFSFFLKVLFMCLLLVIQKEVFSQCQLLIDQDFNHWNDRKYTVSDAKSDFNNKIKPWTASTYRGLSAPGASSNLIGNVAQETRIVNGELRAEYTKNDAGGYAGGFLFDPYFDGVEEAYLEYKVKFDDNFFWATGGKLPGLGGSTSGINSETTGRGTIPSGCKYNTNGWSARLMWRRNRAQTTEPYLILYSYFAEKDGGGTRVDGDCGDAKRIYTGLNDNTWYTIRQYVKMNTPGQKDGVVIMWINGVETYRDTQAKIRNSGKGNLKINALIMNTYRGGSRTDPVWHSPRDEYAFFDDFKVWTGCGNPPDGTTNQAPTGSFEAPTFDQIEEGYPELYVRVDASDPNGDDIDITLKIDGNEVRTERSGPFEWGHDPVSSTDDFTFETLNLTPGPHLLEAIITDDKGASTTISKTITVIESKAPYLGSPTTIPGMLQAEYYDKGGEGVSYSDNDSENKGTAQSNFRINDGVDIGAGNEGNVLGWTSTNEWTEYTVDVTESGSYNVILYYSAREAGAKIGLSSEGQNLFDDTDLPMTGDFGNYSTLTMNSVALNEGEQILRVRVAKNGFNLDKIEFVRSTVTSIDDEQVGHEISVYPNPSTNGRFHVESSTEWRVVTSTGVVIKTGIGELIDLSSEQKGLYFLEIDQKFYPILNK